MICHPGVPAMPTPAAIASLLVVASVSPKTYLEKLAPGERPALKFSEKMATCAYAVAAGRSESAATVNVAVRDLSEFICQEILQILADPSIGVNTYGRGALLTGNQAERAIPAVGCRFSFHL